MNVYDFSVKNRSGRSESLSQYKGKVLLIVNTATGCGFTPQYDELEAIYKDYSQKGFEILDFPCNQFANQAPGTDEEIHSFCKLRFGTTFPQFSKIDVNGENADPLFKWLTDNTKFEGFGSSEMGNMLAGVLEKFDKNYADNSSVKWNFTKFLIDKNGNIIKRFEPTASLDIVRKEIESLL